MAQIGIPREVKGAEYRVSLTPGAVEILVEDGHEVLVENGAGVGSGFDDHAYVTAGARLVSVEQAWASELVVKVKEPQAREVAFLRADLVLFAYLHLAAEPDLARALLAKNVVGVAYETVRLPQGQLPLLAPMSEIAGQVAVHYAVGALYRPHGGRGVLAGSVAGVAPARFLIIGGGVVGQSAAGAAAGLGVRVTVLDNSVTKLRELRPLVDSSIDLEIATRDRVAALVREADVVIGAVLIDGASAPKVITREMLRSMRAGSVVCDVSIDQGGCCETARPTTHEEPMFEEEGIQHCCVTNLPGAVPATATLALSASALPYVRELAAKGWRQAMRDDPALACGLNTCSGAVAHPGVAAALGTGCVSVDRLLSEQHGNGARA